MQVSLVTGVNSKAGAGLRSRPKESEMAKLDILDGLLPFVIVLLSYAVISLEVNSLSNSLQIVKSSKGFF